MDSASMADNDANSGRRRRPGKHWRTGLTTVARLTVLPIASNHVTRCAACVTNLNASDRRNQSTSFVLNGDEPLEAAREHETTLLPRPQSRDRNIEQPGRSDANSPTKIPAPNLDGRPSTTPAHKLHRASNTHNEHYKHTNRDAALGSGEPFTAIKKLGKLKRKAIHHPVNDGTPTVTNNFNDANHALPACTSFHKTILTTTIVDLVDGMQGAHSRNTQFFKAPTKDTEQTANDHTNLTATPKEQG